MEVSGINTYEMGHMLVVQIRRASILSFFFFTRRGGEGLFYQGRRWRY